MENLLKLSVMEQEQAEVTRERKECNKCGMGEYAIRVKRGFLVKLIFWLPIKRYRCNFCGKTAYMLGSNYRMVTR